MPLDDLIVRTLQGRATPDEVERLEAWQSASPENQRHVERLAKVWKISGLLAPDVDPTRAPTLSDGEGEEKGAAGRSSATQGRYVLFPPIGGRVWLAWFAALVVLLAAGFGAGYLATPAERDGGLPVVGAIATGVGELSTVSLADGSTIRLGPESRIRFSGDDREQFIDLEGRAFFGVQADSSRRFSVRTPLGRADVFGTRFEVRSEDDEFRVLVVEGTVQVQAGGGLAQLGEGEMSRSRDGESLSQSHVGDVLSHLDWMGRALVFQGTPLSMALEEIERRYRVTVTLVDAELGELAVTMAFTDRPLEEVFMVLCEVIVARCTVDGDRVRIVGDDGARAMAAGGVFLEDPRTASVDRSSG